MEGVILSLRQLEMFYPDDKFKTPYRRRISQIILRRLARRARRWSVRQRRVKRGTGKVMNFATYYGYGRKWASTSIPVMFENGPGSAGQFSKLYL